MTLIELAERDLRRAEMNLERAKQKPNVPKSELEHLESLCSARKEVFEMLSRIRKEKKT